MQQPAPIDPPEPQGNDALRIVALYAGFACAWILLSDSVVAWLFSDIHALSRASMLKGWLFVLVTSGLLFILISRLIGDFRRAMESLTRKEAELLESRHLLLEAQQTASLGSYELDIVTGRWKTSAIADRLLGLDALFVRSMAGWQSLVHPEDWPRLSAHFTNEILVKGQPFSLRYRIIRPRDQVERWIHAHGVVDRDARGQPNRLHGTFQDVTEQQRAQAQVEEAKNRLQATLDALPDLLFEVGADGRILQYHSHRSDLLAAPPEVFIGKRISDVLPKDAAAICHQAIEDAGRVGFSGGLRYSLMVDQAPHWFDLSVVPMAAAQDGERHFILIARDVTERVQAEKQLELAGLVFGHAREGIMVTDAAGVLEDVNEAYTRISGYNRSESIGRNANILSSGQHPKDFYNALWASLLQAGYWSGELWNRHKNGDVYATLLTISAVYDPQGQVNRYVGLFSDITAIKRYQSELESIAHFDVLTGLPNRLLLADRLKQAMVQSQRRGQKVMVVYLDLDGFKSVNDAYGHDVGDKLLLALGQRLGDLLREGDTLARLGGDEFVAILLDLEGGEPVLPLVARLIGAAADAFHLDGLTIRLSASAGVSSYPQATDLDADQLLRQADQAMYQAKVAGKNRYHVFDTQLDSDIRGHFESLERMRLALCRNEFVLHYQPKVNMRAGRLIGVEALIRWQHPERGLLPPASFLPGMEDHPLSIEVGEWVIDEALQQHARWRSEGLHIPVSVNVGAMQLQQSDFVQRLQAVLHRHPDVHPSNLQIEILETSAVQDLQQVTTTIATCKRMGVDFALDDFGTGYSSLTYLRQLPIAQLKIDQSFVRGMLNNAEDQAILRGVVGLAQAFGRDVIAEGVETEAHGTLLLQLGCEAAQGYGIARPMQAEAIATWLQDWRPRPEWLAQPAPLALVP